MLAYIVPYALFALVLALKSVAPIDPAWLILLAYGATAVCLFVYKSHYTELSLFRSSKREWILGILIGLLGIALWIAPYHLWAGFQVSNGLFGLMGQTRQTFNPHEMSSSGLFYFFICARTLGYVLVTPVFEELFIRSFLIRYLINPDFKKVPIGAYTALSFFGSAVFFALTHTEWIVALIYALLLNTLLIKTKSFNACVIAHGVSNLVLTAYVFTTGSWGLW